MWEVILFQGACFFSLTCTHLSSGSQHIICWCPHGVFHPDNFGPPLFNSSHSYNTPSKKSYQLNNWEWYTSIYGPLLGVMVSVKAGTEVRRATISCKVTHPSLPPKNTRDEQWPFLYIMRLNGSWVKGDSNYRVNFKIYAINPKRLKYQFDWSVTVGVAVSWGHGGLMVWVSWRWALRGHPNSSPSKLL